MANPVQQAIAVKQEHEQRFRAALISSTGVHLLVLLAVVFGPGLWPQPILTPRITSVRLIRLPPPEPEPAAPAAPQEEEQQPEPEPQEPEPLPVVTTEPEPIPRSIEELRREQEEKRRRLAEEEDRRQRDEAERRRREEEKRKQREEEERKRREEEARRQPQKAARRTTQPPRPRQQSARRTIDFTGTESGQQNITVEEFPFVDYVLRIKDMIGARWEIPARGAYARERRVGVFFRIGRNGRLQVQPRVDTSSGDTLFDQAALRAVASAAPFPPLPREYQGQSLGVRFAFVQE